MVWRGTSVPNEYFIRSCCFVPIPVHLHRIMIVPGLFSEAAAAGALDITRNGHHRRHHHHHPSWLAIVSLAMVLAVSNRT